MKTLHFDCFAGISGDMTLGAFIDLGIDPDYLRAELAKLNVGGWTLDFHRDERCGISGTHAVVGVEENDAAHHHHHHDEEHDHDAHDHHEHHSWKEIRSLIEASAITAGAKRRALAIFLLIAKAESQVHGVPEDDIAFHEVGALDSIIDIVGAAICLDALAPERITSSAVELGSGTITCAHGVLPVPAPATLILCKGMSVKTGGFQKEMTTPTGAAILAASVDEYIDGAAFTEIKTGYGIGTRKLDKPNVLRISIREENADSSAGANGWISEKLVLMEANIDDMTGEELGFLMERLFDAGALDVTQSACVMKKSRQGTLVSVLCPPSKLDALRKTLFAQSSTIGFRETNVERLSLRRTESTVTGGFGSGRVKTVFLGDTAIRSKIEYEDRARVAREQGISLAEAGRLMAANNGQ